MVRMPAARAAHAAADSTAPHLSGGAPLAVYVELRAGEEPPTTVPLDTRRARRRVRYRAAGVVKRVIIDYPSRAEWEVVAARTVTGS